MEILSNKGRITRCCDNGNQLVADGHYASDQTQKDVNIVGEEWEKLLRKIEENINQTRQR